MAYTPFEELQGRGPVTIDSDTQHTLTASGQEIIQLPEGDFIANAQMTKDGHDLVLEAPDGSVVVIEGYYLAEPAPVLQAPDGSALTPELVDAFAKAPSEFAQTGSLNDESPVGAIEELSGDARITRADGTVETVQIGTPVYQGDVIETSGDGAVNIVFIDETSFAISENARMAIDEYVFDPATESGKQNFSVLRGVFVFTSGLIGRDDPDDVEIDTPVGSIGIRGTIIAGDIQPGGESEITVIEGAIVVRNGVNEETLSLQFESVKLNGYDAGIERTGVMDAENVNKTYGAVRNVSPTLFSSLDDAAQEQDNSQNGQAQEAQEQQQQDAAGQPTDDAPALEGDPDQPVQDGEAAPADGTVNQTQQSTEGEVVEGAAPAGDQPVQNGEQAPSDGTVQEPVPSAKDPALNLDGTQNFEGQNDAFTGENTILTGSNNPAPAGTGGPAPTNTAGTAPATGGGTQQQTTQPTTTQTTETQNPPPFALDIQKFDLPVGNFNAGFIVGHVKTTNLFGQVQFNLLGGNGNFELVRTGTHEAVIKLTATGYAALGGAASGNFNFVIEAVRNGSVTKTATITTSIFDPTVSDHTLPDGYGDALFNSAYASVITDTGISNRIGYSMTGGDFNDDGFADLIFTNDTNNMSPYQHHNYVVNGAAGLDGSTNGAVGGLFAPTIAYNPFGSPAVPPGGEDYSEDFAVNIGDFDGDGIDDFAMGFQKTSTSLGSTYINTSEEGYVISFDFGGGVTGQGLTGASISGVGDLDLDGYDDMIVGSPGGNYAHLVYGFDTTADAAVNPSTETISGASGFGSAVIGAGDFDGDGLADIAVAELGSVSGNVYLYKNDGAGGLQTPVVFLGFDTNTDDLPLFNLGDVNGDGQTDLMMVSIGDGADNGTGYVVMGGTAGGAISATGSPHTNSATLELHGAGAAGDWNGDGYDDFVLVAADGSDSTQANIYVVYGRADWSGLPASGIDQTWLDISQNAFKTTVDGIANLDNFDFTVSNVGDMNGDGFDEVAIGTPDLGSDDGQVAILYGRETGNTKVGANVTATANGDSLVGTAGADTLSDKAAGVAVALDVSMSGGAGNDTFKIFATSFSASPHANFDGGSGFDTIHANSGLDFSDLKFEQVSGIEEVKAGASGSNMTLTVENIFNLLQSSDDGTLYISQGAAGGNTLTIGADGDPTDDIDGIAAAMGVSAGDVDLAAGSLNGETYDKITIGNYDLYIDSDFASITVS